MKAPDKIYLERDYPDNGVLPVGLHYAPSQSDIQYIRKEALMEWINYVLSNNNTTGQMRLAVRALKSKIESL